MFSPELMKFLLGYQQEEKSSKRSINFNDGNRLFDYKKLATVPIRIRTK